MGMAPPLSGDSASTLRALVPDLHHPLGMRRIRWQDTGQPVAPMVAVRGEAPIADEGWVYEPSYDGQRALVAVEPGVGRHAVQVWSPRGRDETARYPDIVRALSNLARRLRAAVVLDGDLVAVDAGRPALVAFDVLRDGDEDLRPLPLTTRRAHLENILANVGAGPVRLGEFVAGDGRALSRKAAAAGRDTIVAKRLDAPYRAGRRSGDWREIAIQGEPASLPARPLARHRVTTRPAPGMPGLLASVIQQLTAIEASGGAGTVELPSSERLAVSGLDKIYWPEPSVTKRDLMRYYVGISPLLLPAVANRPLVMRRFPNGVAGHAFYQQHAPPDAPAGVAVLSLPGDRVVPSRLIGGSLLTLLYMVQIGVIAQDPWVSRVRAARRAGALRHPERAEDVRGERAARLHPPAAAHAVRRGTDLLPAGGDGRGRAPSRRGHHRAQRQRAGPPCVRRLSAEQPRQDAGHGLQRAGKR